jgi:hypothetical protein
MKTITKLVVATFTLAVMLYSCKQSEAPAEDGASENVKSEKDVVSSSAAVEKNDSNRKFIRTADIKFKVKNVPQSTYAIENAVAKFGGFVTYTNLQSTISEKTKTKISQDSTLETIKYDVENNITIRVPNRQLDTILKTVAKQIDFLDSRVIKADDVSLQMLANQLAQNRSVSHEKRVQNAIDNKGKKLHTIIDAEENLNAKKEANDTKKLENLSLQDQVNFSTLTLQIYQRETIKQEIVANEKVYRENIGSKILNGLKTGWFLLEGIIAFVVQLWSLALIGIVGYLVYKKYLKQYN